MVNVKKSSKQVWSRRKIIIGLIIISLVALAATGFYYNNGNKTSDHVKRDVSLDKDINYDPPTEEEIKSSDAQKDENLKQEEAARNQPSDIKPNIVVVDASQYDKVVEVRAYVSNILEDGGKCTAVFTRNGTTVSKASNAFRDATTTQCRPIEIPRSEFPTAGEWQVVMKYKSATTSGESAKRFVKLN